MNYQESKLVGLQKDVTLLITIASSTTLDTTAERVLFMALEQAIDKTLVAMRSQATNALLAKLISECRFNEWEDIINELAQQH